MKKLIYSTIAIIALSFTTNAQTEPAKKETNPKKEATAKPAATAEAGATTEANPAKSEPAKKSGTRMAINQKGLPGEKKPNNTTTNNPK